MAQSYSYLRTTWDNDHTPAINEEHLNNLEEGIVRVYEILNNDIVLKEKNKQLSSNDFTDEYKNILSLVDSQPSLNSSNLVKSGGVYKSLSDVRSEITAAKSEVRLDINRVENIFNEFKSKAFGQGGVKELATVATTGDYNDLKNTIKRYEDLPEPVVAPLEKIANRVYSLTEGTPSDSTYPTSKAVVDYINSVVKWYEGEYR